MKEHGASCFPPNYDDILDFYILILLLHQTQESREQTDIQTPWYNLFY